MNNESEHRKFPIATVLRVTCGNFLEMYDFMIFGYFSAAIAKAYFPNQSDFNGLMLSLATFGAGFLMRPLGALVLGGYTDRRGRRAGLLLTLALMAFGTLSIACTPGYARIGVAAPVIVLLGRLLQGLSAGAELGSVSVYLSEIAPAHERGFYVSWQSASQQLAVVFAALLGFVLSAKLPPAAMNSWGWRVPLWIGCALIPFLFFIRRTLEETPGFLAKRKRFTTTEILRAVLANWRIVLIGTMLTTMTTTAFYMITAYTPTYGANALHLDKQSTFIVTLCVGALNFAMLPVMGSLSDRIGRRPLLVACTVLTLVTAYPFMAWLVQQPSFARLLCVELWLALLYASYNGAMVVYLTEIMPADVRSTGFSLAYSIATAVFGGYTPAICTYLIHATRSRAIPGAWLSTAALLALTAVVCTMLVPGLTGNPRADRPVPTS
ncbi:Predicted arabinose efflux permease, MFS family [Bryocella elongata]|uniref:Predicted arabinose efflux permease, MFS family n=1 Tax=Bryocella elongata TaxID=863522 RepID=A0A1H6AVD9_9BACT|nr:MFS transporter [Bryocella elongata]SEG52220.1 Predicted arabinose efflux permease, MFS family [Bryocella elongata]